MHWLPRVSFLLLILFNELLWGHCLKEPSEKDVNRSSSKKKRQRHEQQHGKESDTINIVHADSLVESNESVANSNSPRKHIKSSDATDTTDNNHHDGKFSLLGRSDHSDGLTKVVYEIRNNDSSTSHYNQDEGDVVTDTATDKLNNFRGTASKDQLNSKRSIIQSVINKIFPMLKQKRELWRYYDKASYSHHHFNYPNYPNYPYFSNPLVRHRNRGFYNRYNHHSSSSSQVRKRKKSRSSSSSSSSSSDHHRHRARRPCDC